MNQEEEIKKSIDRLIRNASGFEQLAYLIKRSALLFEDIADGFPNEKLDNLENAVISLNTLMLLAMEERVKLQWRFVDWGEANEFAVFARGQKGEEKGGER